MSKFQFRDPPFTWEEEMELDRRQAAFEQEECDRVERIRRFDSVPTYTKLESYRKKNRISQSDMAKLMDVSKRSYCDYESGQTPIPYKALRKLAEETDIDFNAFIVGDVKRADKNHSLDIIRQTRKIVAYCCKNNRQISGTEAFAVAELFVVTYGVDTNLLDTGVDEGSRIDDCIRCVTRDPEDRGIFE